MKIQISGKQGEGKSTIINILAEALIEKGYRIHKIYPRMDSADIDSNIIKIEELFSELSN